MKRLLSLTLALVMLVLAVPVFALPLTAEADDATLNFYVGPTKTNGMNTLGTKVSDTTVAQAQLPSDAQLAAAGSTLTNADIVGWYTWSYAEEKFISVMDYLLGERKATGDLNFYPITKDSTTVPWYSGWIDGENQFLWSFEGEPVNNVSEGTLGAFTGGWYFGSYVGDHYKTFDYIDYTSTWLFLRSDYQYQARGCAYLGNGGWWKVQSVEEKDSQGVVVRRVPTAEALTYQAPIGGTVDVKLPYAYSAGTYAVIAVNGTIVWPEDAAGNKAAAPTAEDFEKWYQVPADTNKVVNRATRYADANCKKVALDVSEGDKIQILFASQDGTVTGAQWWYPAVEYTSDITNIQNASVAVSYYLSPTTELGSATKGTPVASYERIMAAGLALPTAEQMTAVGLNAADMIGWYYWDAAEETFREAKEYLEGIMRGLYPIPEKDLYFYPIMKDSTTVPYYSGWITGENQPIIENGQLLAYTGGWSYGLWDDQGYQTLDTYKSSGLYAGENTKNFANVSANSAFKSSGPNATVLTYHATVAGKVTVRIPKAYYAFSLAFAQNDTFLWPKALEGQETSNSNASVIIGNTTGDYGWIGEWKGTDRTQRYQNVQATLSFDVDAGDRLYFMMYTKNDISLWWYPQVVYDTVYTAPSASANLSVGSSLSVNTAVSVPEGLEGVVESGVLVDGEKLEGTTIPVAAKEAGKTITVQPYYVMESGITIYGKESVITVKDMLEEYATSEDETVKAAAEATLDYTAAADAYFDEAAAAPEIVAPAGKDAYVEKSESIGVSEYEGESKVEFRGISLLLNDRINIKIVIKGELPAGAELQISKSASFDELETLISGSPTEDEKGTKFIMDGISAQNWNTDYYIRVVDADKNVISDTLCYSVAAYYGRMIDRAEASDKLKAVISSLMSLYEAVSTAN